MAALQAVTRTLLVPTSSALDGSCYRRVSGRQVPSAVVRGRSSTRRTSVVRAEKVGVDAPAPADSAKVSDAVRKRLEGTNEEPSKVTQQAASKIAGLRDTVWGQRAQAPKYPTLDKDLTVDVVIMGAGIAGLSIGYNLVKAGKTVAILDAKSRGSGQTGKTTAHLMSWNDDYYFQLEQMFGKEKMKKVKDSHFESIDWVEKTIKEEGIECEFQRCEAYLVPAADEKSNYDMLEMERESMIKAGADVKEVDLKNDPSYGSFGYALSIPGSADFHPLKYLDGLADAITKKGGKIFELTRVVQVDNNVVTTDKGHKVTAEAVVFATNSPSNHNLAIHTRQNADRSYVVGLKVPKGSVKKAMWWDTHSPYHYVRTEQFPDYDVLVVGGEDHNAGQHPDEYRDHFNALTEWAKKRWTMAGEALYKWTGQVYKPTDFLGLYGREPLDVTGCHYIATGHSGQGMTGGTIAGLVISDLITKGDHKWADIFDPSRLPPAAPQTIMKFFGSEVKTVTQGYAETVLPKDLHSADDVPKNTGAVIASGADKIAVYRDNDGSVHEYSAICPHLKCLVQWNPVDGTFDCPCHGSQFDCHGKLVQGPAKMDLEPYTPKQ